MKQPFLLLTTGISLCLLLCTTGCKPAPMAEEIPASIPTVSYKAVMIQHSVAAYPAWKEVYLADDSLRKVNGMFPMFIARGTEDTNTVIVMNKITDIEKARSFATSEGLKMTMEKAGVNSLPIAAYMDVIRDDTSSISQDERVMVVHKVKDFDTWLKVYDAEGMVKRAENGLVDRGLARDMDDPNKVYIVFAVTDKAKAMARMQSDELIKLMADAGVEGQPTIYFYTRQK